MSSIFILLDFGEPIHDAEEKKGWDPLNHFESCQDF